MKNKLKWLHADNIKGQTITVVISWLIVLIVGLLVFSLSSCDHSKQAAKHYRKFQDHGGKVICPNDVQPLTYIDTTVFSIAHDWKCPEIEFPKSKVEIRQEEKTERARVRQEAKSDRTETKAVAKVDKEQAKQEGRSDRTETRQNEKTERKQIKAESKGVKWWWWIIAVAFGIVGVVAGYFIRIIVELFNMPDSTGENR